MRSWARIGAVAVVALATAAAAASAAPPRNGVVIGTFVVSFTGTNTVEWTIPAAPGLSCDLSNETRPVSGSGGQTITMSTAGLPAAPRTAKLTLSLYRGRLVDEEFTFNPNHVFYPFLSLTQTDTRKGEVSAPGSGGCLASGEDFKLGGPGSSCGTKRVAAAGQRGPQLSLEPERNGDYSLVKKGGLAFGVHTESGALGSENAGNDPYEDCPAAGGQLPFWLQGQMNDADAGNAFLLYEHDTLDDVGLPIPAYGRLPIARLLECRAKTLTVRYSSGPVKTSGLWAPFMWNGNGDLPADWARWHATTTLDWALTLRRVGCWKH